MYKTICITSRHLVAGDYLQQIKKALQRHPDALILREKDLTPDEYERLASLVMPMCRQSGVTCILHSFVDVAERLHADYIHLPMQQFLSLPAQDRKKFRGIGASAHSLSDALAAEKNKAAWITASHIFATDCKKGLPPRGLDFLREVCNAVSIPVYALGGIHEKQIPMCIEAGADGVCMMSDFMR